VLERVIVQATVAVLADPGDMGLMLKEFDNQRIVRSSYRYSFQTPSPKLARLREMFDLDQVVAAGKSDMERLVLLRNWVRHQCPHNEGSCRRPWDAINILSSPEQLKASFAFTAALAEAPRLRIPGEAVDTALSSTPELTLTRERPRRVFRVVVPTPGLLAAAMKWDSETPREASLHVYSEQLDYLGAGEAAVAKGDVFVVASVKPDDIEVPSAGILSFAHTRGNDPHEPDGSFTDARAIQAGDEVEFTLSPAGDRDFFRCQIEKTGYLQVRVDKSAANELDPWVAIYDEDHRQIGRDNARVRRGTVYVQIGESHDDEASQNGIKATFEFAAETDGSEPNGSFAQARAVQPNSVVDFCLMPTGDRDCFRLQTDEPGYLQVSVDRSAAPHLDPRADVYGERQELLGNDAARVPPGVLYVVIGDTRRTFTHGPTPIDGIGSSVEMEDISANTFKYCHMDHRGTVFSASDANEAVKDTYNWNAWGELLSEAESGFSQRFGYQSNWLRLAASDDLSLSPTRLYHAGAGRFLQSDQLLTAQIGALNRPAIRVSCLAA